MTTLSPDEVALIKSFLTALRGIKVRDIDKALVILNKRSGETCSKSTQQNL
jgi:hypothetical protein